MVAVAGLLTAGPALAHESPPVPVATTPVVGSMPVAEGMAGETATGASQWRYVLAVLAATAVGTLALRLALLRFKPDFTPRRADSIAAAALVFTGIAHCAVAPEHWREGWHLGLFFVASGLVLMGQALAVSLRPTARAYGWVGASTVGLIVLYFLARQVSLPLVGHSDPYLLEELPVKLAEALAAALAVATVVRSGPATGRLQPAPARS